MSSRRHRSLNHRDPAALIRAAQPRVIQSISFDQNCQLHSCHTPSSPRCCYVDTRYALHRLLVFKCAGCVRNPAASGIIFYRVPTFLQDKRATDYSICTALYASSIIKKKHTQKKTHSQSGKNKICIKKCREGGLNIQERVALCAECIVFRMHFSRKYTHTVVKTCASISSTL